MPEPPDFTMKKMMDAVDENIEACENGFCGPLSREDKLRIASVVMFIRDEWRNKYYEGTLEIPEDPRIRPTFC